MLTSMTRCCHLSSTVVSVPLRCYDSPFEGADPTYVAPEVVRGSHIDLSADVYAVGRVLADIAHGMRVPKAGLSNWCAARTSSSCARERNCN